MRQSKSGLIKLVNKQGNRSDNDAPQDQCCFVVFVSCSGGLGGPKGCVGLVRCVSNRLLGPRDCVMWVSNRLGCLRGCGVMFYFLRIPNFIFFVNNRGSDAVLGINDI